MLKYEGLQIGQKIKAYDFEPIEGRQEHYVAGRIVDINPAGIPYSCYVIIVEEDTDVNDDYHRLDERVYVPMGTTMDDTWSVPRIQVVE